MNKRKSTRIKLLVFGGSFVLVLIVLFSIFAEGHAEKKLMASFEKAFSNHGDSILVRDYAEFSWDRLCVIRVLDASTGLGMTDEKLRNFLGLNEVTDLSSLPKSLYFSGIYHIPYPMPQAYLFFLKNNKIEKVYGIKYPYIQKNDKRISISSDVTDYMKCYSDPHLILEKNKYGEDVILFNQ